MIYLFPFPFPFPFPHPYLIIYLEEEKGNKREKKEMWKRDKWTNTALLFNYLYAILVSKLHHNCSHLMPNKLILTKMEKVK